MHTWWKRIRAALGLGLLWTVGGLLAGGAIELLDNVLPGGLRWASLVDMWPQTLALLAFPRGVVFAMLLGIARRQRRYDDFSLSEFALWGAVAGLLLGGVTIARGGSIAFAAISTVASAVWAGGSLGVARIVERRALQRRALSAER